jgi:hypothetical protein
MWKEAHLNVVGKLAEVLTRYLLNTSLERVGMDSRISIRVTSPPNTSEL